MLDHDDVRFSVFTRALARRQRRPRSFPAIPATTDCLEQLCGGGSVVAVPEPPGTDPEPLSDRHFEHTLS